jgi:hypothetical protein
MSVKTRIAKLGKIKQPKEELRRVTKAYFDSFSKADLQRMVDNPETVAPELGAEFSRMWEISYRVATDSERAEIDAAMDAAIKELNP